MTSLARRLNDALRPVLHPLGPISPKQLAHAIGVSTISLVRYRNDETGISGETLLKLCEFMTSQGYKDFPRQVLGDNLVASPVVQQLVPVADILQAIQPKDRHFWIIDGVCHEAKDGHANSARQLLGLCQQAEGDIALYAIRNIGAVAITHRHDGRVSLRYHAIAARADNLAALLNWLREHEDRIFSVKVSALSANRWLETIYDFPFEAIEALDSLCALSSVPSTWQQETIDIESFGYPRLHAIRKSAREGIGSTLELVENIGLLGQTTVLNMDTDGPRILFLGKDKPLPIDKMIGKPARAISDAAYGEIIDLHTREAFHSDSFYQLSGTAFGKSVTYKRWMGRAGKESIIGIAYLEHVAA